MFFERKKVRIAVAWVARKVIVASDVKKVSDMGKRGTMRRRTGWKVEGHGDAEYGIA